MLLFGHTQSRRHTHTHTTTTTTWTTIQSSLQWSLRKRFQDLCLCLKVSVSRTDGLCWADVVLRTRKHVRVADSKHAMKSEPQDERRPARRGGTDERCTVPLIYRRQFLIVTARGCSVLVALFFKPVRLFLRSITQQDS